jgi:hypothetical protein
MWEPTFPTTDEAGSTRGQGQSLAERCRGLTFAFPGRVERVPGQSVQSSQTLRGLVSHTRGSLFSCICSLPFQQHCCLLSVNGMSKLVSGP